MSNIFLRKKIFEKKTSQTLFRFLTVLISYFFAGWLGLQIPYVGSQITLVWLPTGIAVVSIMRWGYPSSLPIYLGAFFVNYIICGSIPLSLSIAVGNTLGPILTSWGLKHFGLNFSFHWTKDIILLLVFSALGMILSASGGVLSLYISGGILIDQISFGWISWWMGDFLGILLLTPLLLSINKEKLTQIAKNRFEWFIWIFIASIVIVFSLNLFSKDHPNAYNFELFVLPMAVWAGLRFGIIGGAFSGFFFSIVAAFFTAMGYGIFSSPDPKTGLFNLWIFIGLNVLTGLLMSSMQAKQNRFENEIILKNKELVEKNKQIKEKTDHLATALEEMEAFSYSIAHDLRSPLRTINGFSNLLLSEYSEKFDPQAMHYFRRILYGTDYMGKLIDALLNLSKTSQMNIEKNKFDLSQLAKQIINQLKQNEQNYQNVQVILQEKIEVHADEKLIRIVLQNLLENAFKFSSKAIQPKVELGCVSKNDQKIYFVKDNGIGFNMEYKDKLFKIFQRLHSEKEFFGIGIGLVTVKRIINHHGGQVWAESEINQGATFSFTLN